jgi:hypothetical protein
MATWLKFLIGLAAALAAGLISHWPLGRGAAFVDILEARARAVIAVAGLPQVQVRFSRAPLAREAVLSGQADEFQRLGQGRFPGLNDRVGAIPGVSGVRWEDE